jgi:S1-C subfamily serine protease
MFIRRRALTSNCKGAVVKIAKILVWLIAIRFSAIPAALADDPRERIERGKAATAFVQLPDERSSATAFCISAKGLFVTNHHVVRRIPSDGTVKLILDPNGDTRREITARVLCSDADSDLAVLKPLGAGGDYKFLRLGDDTQLFETMTVTSFGFPFGKILAGKANEFPDISINVGRITALRKSNGKLAHIQLDATLNM